MLRRPKNMGGFLLTFSTKTRIIFTVARAEQLNAMNLVKEDEDYG